jgi:hypothetical protein
VDGRLTGSYPASTAGLVLESRLFDLNFRVARNPPRIDVERALLADGLADESRDPPRSILLTHDHGNRGEVFGLAVRGVARGQTPISHGRIGTHCKLWSSEMLGVR